MDDLLARLAGTLWLRPYVVGFLLLHLAGASALLGWRRTGALSLITWAVAFAAEASSIRTGIPFGWYYYVPETVDRELWILGVPLFDSPSFGFLLTASYGLAWLLLTGHGEKTARPEPGRHFVLTVFLFVLSDVVIDPVALRGERWFLGRIYGYPEPGVYFGVPLANFVGWAVVGVTALALYRCWERRRADSPPGRFAGRAWLCPGLYFLVLAFNLTITFAIGEWGLGVSSLAFSLPPLVWALYILMGPRFPGWSPREEGIRT